MLKRNLIAFITIVIISSPLTVMAKEGCSAGDCMLCHKLSEKEAAEIFKTTGVNVKSVKSSPSVGLFEILLEKDGKQGIVFVDYGKKHIIQGKMLSIPDFKLVAAHAQELAQLKSESTVDTKTLPSGDAFVIGNPNGSRKLYVFTDPDCPYCRQLHKELKKLEKIAPDVAINILLYPLPIHPGSYDKSRVILSSQSRILLDDAFEGKELPKPMGNAGKEMLDRILAFGNAHAISGTPTIILPNGNVIEGGMDAEAMKKALADSK